MGISPVVKTGETARDRQILEGFKKVGLGGSAKLNVGATAGTVAAGDDSRFDSIIGVGQTWLDVLSSRLFNVTYANSTQKTTSVSA